MAMSIPRLAADIATKMESSFRIPTGDANDPNTFIASMALTIATAVINEIKTNARCQGTDSHGDTHDNVQIV